MNKEIVVLGAGKIGRGSVGLFFSRAGWKVDFYGHSPEKMHSLAEQGYYETQTPSGVVSRVEGFDILDCASDDELVERLCQVGVCAVAAYEGAFPAMATSIGKAIQQRASKQIEEPLNVMLCVNDVHVVDTFDSTIRAMLSGSETAFYERTVGLCVVMVMSLGANPPEGSNPWLVLASDDPVLEVDGDPWKGERIVDVPELSWTTNGQGQLVRKVFVGNMSHAMRAFLGHARGMNYMDDGVDEDAWIIDNTLGAMREAYDAVDAVYHFPPEERAETIEHNLDLSAKPAHDPFTRIANSPAKKLSYDNRFVWPARKCLELGEMPFYLARGAAYGLIYYLDTEENGTRPASREEAEALVERICGLSAEGDRALRDLIVDHFVEIPQAGLLTPREATA